MRARATRPRPSTSRSIASRTSTGASSTRRAPSIRPRGTGGKREESRKSLMPPVSEASRRIGKVREDSGNLARELAVAALGSAAIERQVRVRRHERIADLLAAQSHGGAAAAIEAVAIGIEAVGGPHAHADRRETVGRDDGLDRDELDREVADGAPDIAPLLLFGEPLAVHEVGEGAEGDQVVGEDRAGAFIVDRAAVRGQSLEPGAGGGDVVGMRSGAEIHRAFLQAKTLPVRA